MTLNALQWNPSCEATSFASEKWPCKRGGLSSGVKINTFMFRYTLSSGLSKGGGLLSGWPLKSGSTILGESDNNPTINSYVDPENIALFDLPVDYHVPPPKKKSRLRSGLMNLLILVIF